MTSRLVGIAAIAVIVIAAGCSNSKPVSSGPTQGVPPAPQPAQQVSGIVITSFPGDSSIHCDIETIDPTSGAVTKNSSFNIDSLQATSMSCPTGTDEGDTWFSHNYDRLAFTRSDYRAAWVDKDGKVTLIGPATSKPDFGVQTVVTAVGFDKHDNFYYSAGRSDGRYEDEAADYYRVPAGSTSDGVKIGTIIFHPQDGQRAVFGRLPGGTLGVGAEVPLEGAGSWSECHMQMDSNFDPDRHTYYYADQGRIYRSNNWCDNSASAEDADSKNAVIPAGNYGVGAVISSPDGSRLAFMSNGKIYTASSDGRSTPTQLDVPELTSPPARLSTWHFRGWV
jgi:hypothetical protein